MCYNDSMDISYEFSVGWMIAGLVIAAVGGAVVIFYKQIADNLANGVSSYDRVKLFGVITVIVGFVVTANLHTFILEFLVKLIFNR